MISTYSNTKAIDYLCMSLSNGIVWYSEEWIEEEIQFMLALHVWLYPDSLMLYKNTYCALDVCIPEASQDGSCERKSECDPVIRGGEGLGVQ